MKGDVFMKKYRIISLLLVVICCFMVGCKPNSKEINYKFDKSTGTLTITGEGTMDYDDTEKWDMVENPKHVIISDGITNIAENAFDYWGDGETGEHNEFNKLKTVVLPKSLTYIGNEAFISCENLLEVDIPDNVIAIGESAFAYTGIKECIFPDNLTKISFGVCSGCYNLETVELGENVTSIGINAFFGCHKLTEITLPQSLTRIEADAFRFCKSISEITIPESVLKVDGKAFWGCNNMKTAIIEGKDTNLGRYSFGYKDSSKKVKDFTIKGYKGSTAEKYATENGFTFVALDE